MQPKNHVLVIKNQNRPWHYHMCLFFLTPYNNIHSLGVTLYKMNPVYFEHQCEWEPVDIVIMFLPNFMVGSYICMYVCKSNLEHEEA
jgi:hypothetical protein